ncbi:ABC transporter permease [Paenibacillus antarcticus]|uniref:ABC transporter permease n=1 Tax=Paenibacillus antarcticus TaxID=253703 RepID=A0A168NF87_9BACL|nr:ABC transporter permease [Paenibacillus antarcticus]OAB45734.1 ABC transporter permease [Paenibacillus antarcticus]
MTLFSIARKTIRQNFSNYFLYFASMIFSIVIYFVFVSLKYDQTIQASSDTSPKINSVFSGAAVVLIIFVAVFIWYSNSFFTRKRKKEVGLYSLLGVRKKQIGRMLFYENFIMGCLALIVGILLGSVLSKFFVTILMKIMGYNAIVNFTISLEAIINTIIVFMIITLITSFHGYRLIYRFKLIELFQADKEGEQEPRTSFIIALISILLIGIGYWLALQNMLDSAIWRKIGFLVTPLIIIITVILGTYLLFSSLTVYLLKVSRKNKKKYWNGINLIGTSQLLFRIKGNARTLTIIAVLSATTLTAVGAAYSLYYNNRSNVEMADPSSMMFIAEDNNIDEQVNGMITNSKDHDLIYHEAISTLQVDADVTNLNSEFYSNDMIYTVVSNRDFNTIAKLQGRNDVLSLQANEAAVLDAMYSEQMSPVYVGATISLKVNDRDENVTFKHLKKYSIFNYRTAGTTIVVSDELFAGLAKEIQPENMLIYKITNEDNAEHLTKGVQAIMPDEARLSSFYADYTAGLESSGLLIFMGGFLGLVFLTATGSIIYFKQLTEANSDKERYEILHKIGVNKKEIRLVIAKQMAFIFGLPLIAGIAHCAVALTALSRLLQINLVIPVMICMAVYTCIYIAYYFLTVNAYYQTVTKTK